MSPCQARAIESSYWQEKEITSGVRTESSVLDDARLGGPLGVQARISGRSLDVSLGPRQRPGWRWTLELPHADGMRRGRRRAGE